MDFRSFVQSEKRKSYQEKIDMIKDNMYSVFFMFISYNFVSLFIYYAYNDLTKNDAPSDKIGILYYHIGLFMISYVMGVVTSPSGELDNVTFKHMSKIGTIIFVVGSVSSFLLYYNGMFLQYLYGLI